MSWKYRKKINDFMTAVADDSEGEIWVYGDIVDDAWWDDEVSPKTVRNALQDMGNVGTVNIRVNSYGGSVYAGNAIINILDSYRKKTGCKIVAYIEGIAASMGSGIPMVADKVYMAENAMYMLHKPWSISMGNSDDLEKTVDELKKAEDTLVVNYMRKFNGTEDELRQMLADETWLTADEALEWGLCDEIIEAVPIAASARGIRINNREFVTNAGAIAARFTPNTPIAEASYSAKEVIPQLTPAYVTSTNYGVCNCSGNGFLNLNTYPDATLGYIKTEGEKQAKMYKYDEALNAFGITEDVFKTLNMDANTILSLCETIKSAILPEKKEAIITGDMIEKALGEPMSAVDVLGLASIGKDTDVLSEQKATAYDKMVKNAIDVALQNGVRAKGDKFNETKWRKTLESWDYDEIIEQSSEWSEEAKNVFHAGKRVSQPWKQDSSNEYRPIDPKNYDFC